MTNGLVPDSTNLADDLAARVLDRNVRKGAGLEAELLDSGGGGHTMPDGSMMSDADMGDMTDETTLP